MAIKCLDLIVLWINGGGGGGLAIYISNKLIDSSCVIEDYCSSSSDIEQLWISIKEPDCRNKIIGIVYRPPSGNIETCLSEVRRNLDVIQDNEILD